MVYKPTTRRTYYGQRMKHALFTPARHQDFKREWETNFEKAVGEANKLKEQGYLVEESLQRGSFTESQATRVVNSLKSAGCDVQVIPVAAWGGEKVVFVIYKPPKPAEKPQAVSTPKQTSAEPDDAKIFSRYLKMFWKPGGTPPDLQALTSKGYLMEPRRYMAYIPPNAPAQEELVKMFVEQKAKGQAKYVFENSLKVRSAIAKYMKMNKKYAVLDAQGKEGVSLKFLREALNVLGKGKINMYTSGGIAPTYLERNGHTIAIAPAHVDVAEAVPIDEIIGQSQQPSQP